VLTEERRTSIRRDSLVSRNSIMACSTSRTAHVRLQQGTKAHDHEWRLPEAQTDQKRRRFVLGVRGHF
jgi:hypothetical protein